MAYDADLRVPIGKVMLHAGPIASAQNILKVSAIAKVECTKNPRCLARIDVVGIKARNMIHHPKELSGVVV